MSSSFISKLPVYQWSKYAWLLGCAVQQGLKEEEGIKISTPKNIASREKIQLGEATDRYYAEFGPQLDEKEKEVYVYYKGKNYNISKPLNNIIERCWIEKTPFGPEIGSRIHNIDAQKAYNLVFKEIVDRIVIGKID